MFMTFFGTGQISDRTPELEAYPANSTAVTRHPLKSTENHFMSASRFCGSETSAAVFSFTIAFSLAQSDSAITAAV